VLVGGLSRLSAWRDTGQGGNNENEPPMLSSVQQTLNDDDEGPTSLQCNQNVDNFEVNVPRSPSLAS
jgi:hypothetical protein